jgi:hypothetical protein
MHAVTAHSPLTSFVPHFDNPTFSSAGNPVRNSPTLAPLNATMAPPNTAPAAPLPAFLQKQLLETGLAAGRSLAAAALPLRRRAIRQILESGESLRLQFPREDLGFRYTPGSGAAVLEEDAEAEVSASPPSAAAAAGAGGGRGAAFVPSSAPGYRLPHVWLELARTGERVSGRLEWCSGVRCCCWVLGSRGALSPIYPAQSSPLVMQSLLPTVGLLSRPREDLPA